MVLCNLLRRMKRCPKCETWLARESFGPDATRTDGLFTYCRNCCRRVRKSWNDGHPEKTRAWSKRRFDSTTVEQRNAAHRDWSERNKERLRAYGRARYAADPLAALEAHRRWRERHPETSRNSVRRRRARIRGLSGHATTAQVQARIDAYGGRCAYCGWRAYAALDHVIPVSRGGTSWPANLVPSCTTCNVRKSDRLLREWADFSGFHFP